MLYRQELHHYFLQNIELITEKWYAADKTVGVYAVKNSEAVETQKEQNKGFHTAHSLKNAVGEWVLDK
ncbi:hypothetical protein SFC66_05850 [Terribacillus saccharophilus]|uniref:hypothetical protein n=1 Tax=Terribacillus saccharophilus TaxID=361277 RepID=UPI0039821F48